MKEPTAKPTVKLIGQDGNEFSIMGCVKKALKSAGADKEYIDKYISKATLHIFCYYICSPTQFNV